MSVENETVKVCFKMPFKNCSIHNKRVWPLRGRPLWGHPCSWVCACCFGAF